MLVAAWLSDSMDLNRNLCVCVCMCDDRVIKFSVAGQAYFEIMKNDGRSESKRQKKTERRRENEAANLIGV